VRGISRRVQDDRRDPQRSRTTPVRRAQVRRAVRPLRRPQGELRLWSDLPQLSHGQDDRRDLAALKPGAPLATPIRARRAAQEQARAADLPPGGCPDGTTDYKGTAYVYSCRNVFDDNIGYPVGLRIGFESVGDDGADESGEDIAKGFGLVHAQKDHNIGPHSIALIVADTPPEENGKHPARWNYPMALLFNVPPVLSSIEAALRPDRLRHPAKLERVRRAPAPLHRERRRRATHGRTTRTALPANGTTCRRTLGHTSPGRASRGRPDTTKSTSRKQPGADTTTAPDHTAVPAF
jgi:hypothetical protein